MTESFAKQLDDIDAELALIMIDLQKLGIEPDDDEWDLVHQVEVFDISKLRDDLELFIDLVKN